VDRTKPLPDFASLISRMRMLGLTALLESRWEAAGKPEEGFVWPAQTRSGHVEPSSLRKRHSNAFKVIATEAAKNDQKPARPFCCIRSVTHS
jgi:hypothetical protein